jgi:hypothetical protein
VTIERLGGDVPEAGATRPSARRRPPNPNDGTARGLLPAIAGLLALPHIVVLIRVLGFDWVPVSDHALAVLRIHDVGTRHTPLVGVYSLGIAEPVDRTASRHRRRTADLARTHCGPGNDAISSNSSSVRSPWMLRHACALPTES